jgi:hypothetical protein
MCPSWVKEPLLLRVDLALSSSKDGRVGVIEIEFFLAYAGTPKASSRTAARTIAGWSKFNLTMIAVWIKCSMCSHRREFLPLRSAEKSNESEGQRSKDETKGDGNFVRARSLKHTYQKFGSSV